MRQNSSYCQRRPVSCHDFQQLTSTMPLKLSTTSQMLMVKHVIEQNQLINTLMWRSKTSMPVVRILSFKTQSTTYPKMYNIEVEGIEKSVKNLNGVQLNDCLYLIQQCVLGIQALRYKFHNFDFHSVFYGVTQNGVCKVWISSILSSYKTNFMPLPAQDIIISQILRMVRFLACTNAKNELNQLILQVSRQTKINFQEFYLRLGNFAYDKKIVIPSFIFLQKKSGLFGRPRANSLAESVQKINECNNTQINFRYQSPLTKSALNPTQNQELNKKLNTNNKYKSKVTWQYQNYQQNSPTVKIVDTQSSTDAQKQYQFQSDLKPIDRMLQSPSKLKNLLINSKNCLRSSKISSTISCQKQGKSQQTSTSLTMMNKNYDNLLSVCNSLIKGGSQNGGNLMRDKNGNKTSALSIQMESSVNLTLSNNQIKFQQVQQNQMNQIKIFSPKIKEQINVQNDKYHVMFNEYSFGGLLKPLPQKSIKQSQQIDQSVFDEPQYRHISHQAKRNDRILRSLVLSNEDINVMIPQWQWKNKMSKLLSQDPTSLKTSVYCGQQKKPEPLQIKLEMLGKMGRQITSMLPQSQ